MHRIERNSDRSIDEASTATHHVALFSLPAYGHVNPTLRTARELVERGHDVTYYLPERFAEVVEPTGATFERLDDDYDLMDRIDAEKPGTDSTDNDADERRERLVRFMSGRLDAVPSLVDRVAGDGADGVVTDPMCLWGRAVADELDAPTVSFNTSFAMREGSPLIEHIRSSDGGGTPLPSAITDVLTAFDIDDPDPSDFFVADADRSIVPLTREFQPDAESFGDDHAFVGPMVRAGGEQRDAGLPLDRLTERPSVYISLGTVVHGDDDFFETCIDAFDDGDWEVVLKAKGDAERLDAESPGNVHVRSRVPQLDVLERVDAFVTHGGMNSTMESLSLGTPSVVVPQMADQYLVAEQVETSGVGIALDREDPTAAELRDAVETVSAAAYYGAIEEFNASAGAAGGAERAADVIEKAMADG
ncbi:macrolide family glycosyltransferase [Haladaptatus sp. CMAA 1911]|uniref:macrolide family glycosyltransferase n=1 Tax=unclassified Haladaptatus TaxID=2622732 RepID=UPI0037540574